MRRCAVALAVLVVAIAAFGCSGSGGGRVVPQAIATLGSTKVAGPAGSAPMTMTIKVPARSAASGSRSGQYVSPSTQGLAIKAYPATTSAPSAWTALVDLSASAPNCTSNSDGSRSCSITFAAPIGTDLIAVTAYDQPPSTAGATPAPQGSPLSQTATGIITAIAPNQVNTLSITLGGIIASLRLQNYSSGSNASVSSLYLTNYAALLVTAFDADGNVIAGDDAYANPVTFSAVSCSDADSCAIQLSEGSSCQSGYPNTSEQFVYPGSVLCIAATGAAFTQITLSATSSSGSVLGTYTINPAFQVYVGTSSGQVAAVDPSQNLVTGSFTDGVGGTIASLAIDSVDGLGYAGDSTSSGVLTQFAVGPAPTPLATSTPGSAGVQSVIWYAPGSQLFAAAGSTVYAYNPSYGTLGSATAFNYTGSSGGNPSLLAVTNAAGTSADNCLLSVNDERIAVGSTSGTSLQPYIGSSEPVVAIAADPYGYAVAWEGYGSSNYLSAGTFPSCSFDFINDYQYTYTQLAFADSGVSGAPVWLLGLNGSTLDVYSMANITPTNYNLSPTHTISLPSSNTGAMTVNPAGTFAFVADTSLNSDAVYMVDLIHDSVTATLHTGLGSATALATANTYAYYNSFTDAVGRARRGAPQAKRAVGAGGK